MKKIINIHSPFIQLLIFILSTFNLSAQQKNEVELINTEEKKELIRLLCNRLDSVYLYPENVSKIRKYLNKKIVHGDYTYYKTNTDFAIQLDKDLKYITNDKHMGLVYDPKKSEEMIKEPNKNYYTSEVLEDLREKNFEFRELKILDGNVGYLDLREFCPVKYAGETAIAAMNFLANCNAIIIDLRNNGGGDDNMVQFLLSYFLDADIQFATSYNRFTNSYYTSQTLAYVPGKKLYNTPLYLLTSKSTFSGAEAFSYYLKFMKRATLIGENTGGGENPVEIQVLHKNYIAYIPAVKIINSISKTNIRWETIGVKPDIQTDSKDAFYIAQTKALEDLSAKNVSKKEFYLWIIEGLKAKQSPYKIDKATLKSYSGSYGDRKLIYDNETLFYERKGSVKAKLNAIDNETFTIEGIDYLRLKIIKKDKDTIALLRLYNDGTTKEDLKEN